MKRKFLLLASLCLYLAGTAQTDTTGKDNKSGDTLRVGNMIIVRDGKAGTGDGAEIVTGSRHHRNSYRPSNVVTSLFIVDLGFANFNDKTAYASQATQQFAPG